MYNRSLMDETWTITLGYVFVKILKLDKVCCQWVIPFISVLSKCQKTPKCHKLEIGFKTCCIATYCMMTSANLWSYLSFIDNFLPCILILITVFSCLHSFLWERLHFFIVPNTTSTVVTYFFTSCGIFQHPNLSSILLWCIIVIHV